MDSSRHWGATLRRTPAHRNNHVHSATVRHDNTPRVHPMSSMPPDCAPDRPGCEHSHGILGAGDRSRELRGAGKRSLALALVLIVGYMFVEVVGGLLSGSLAADRRRGTHADRCGIDRAGAGGHALRHSRARPITSMSRPCATECRMWMAWPVCTTFTAGRSPPVTTRSLPTSRSTPAVPRRSVTTPSWTGCATSRTTSSS